MQKKFWISALSSKVTKVWLFWALLPLFIICVATILNKELFFQHEDYYTICFIISWIIMSLAVTMINYQNIRNPFFNFILSSFVTFFLTFALYFIVFLTILVIAMLSAGGWG